MKSYTFCTKYELLGDVHVGPEITIKAESEQDAWQKIDWYLKNSKPVGLITNKGENTNEE